MTEETNNPPTDATDTPAEAVQAPVWHFTMVLAEVIYTCEMGLQSRRVQFVSKADGNVFPRQRLLELQQRAAMAAIAEVKALSKGAIQRAEVEGVYLLGTIDCGWMTEAEFLGGENDFVAADETPVTNTGTQVQGDNVVPFPGS